MVEKAALSRSAFLISSAVAYGYSPYSREAGVVMFADERDERLRVLFPILREAFEIREDRRDAGRAEQCDSILGVLVEVRVEDALVLKVQSGPDVEQHPPEVVQPQGRERLRAARDRLAVCPDGVLATLLDFRDDRESVARRCPRKNWTVTPAFEFEIAFFRDGHRGGFGPILVRHFSAPFLCAADANVTPIPGQRRAFERQKTEHPLSR
jgi:hypothetical protein